MQVHAKGRREKAWSCRPIKPHEGVAASNPVEAWQDQAGNSHPGPGQLHAQTHRSGLATIGTSPGSCKGTQGGAEGGNVCPGLCLLPRLHTNALQ